MALDNCMVAANDYVSTCSTTKYLNLPLSCIYVMINYNYSIDNIVQIRGLSRATELIIESPISA